MPDAAAFSAFLRRTNRARPQANVVMLRPAESARALASVHRTLTAVFRFYDFHSDTALGRALAVRRQQRAAVLRGTTGGGRHPLAVDCAEYFVTTPKFLLAHEAQRTHRRAHPRRRTERTDPHRREEQTVLVKLESLIASLRAAP